MYIPPEDRRMCVLHSELQKGWHAEAHGEDYFTNLFAWCDSEGYGHVAAWLKARDLSKFNPKSSPPQTRGWQAVTASWGEPEDCVAQALDRLGRPAVVLGQELSGGQFDNAEELANMLKSPRKIAHRMLKAGYAQVPPPEHTSRWHFAKDGQSIKARYAFVKSGLAASSAEAARLVREHGAKLLAKKAQKI